MRMEQTSLLFQRLFSDFQTSMPEVLEEVAELSRKRRLCMRKISRMLAETQLHCAAQWRSDLGTWLVGFHSILLLHLCMYMCLPASSRADNGLDSILSLG